MVGGALVHLIHFRHIESLRGSSSSTEINLKGRHSRNRLRLRARSCIMPVNRTSGEDSFGDLLVVG